MKAVKADTDEMLAHGAEWFANGSFGEKQRSLQEKMKALDVHIAEMNDLEEMIANCSISDIANSTKG